MAGSLFFKSVSQVRHWRHENEEIFLDVMEVVLSLRKTTIHSLFQHQGSGHDQPPSLDRITGDNHIAMDDAPTSKKKPVRGEAPRTGGKISLHWGWRVMLVGKFRSLMFVTLLLLRRKKYVAIRIFCKHLEQFRSVHLRIKFSALSFSRKQKPFHAPKVGAFKRRRDDATF